MARGTAPSRRGDGGRLRRLGLRLPDRASLSASAWRAGLAHPARAAMTLGALLVGVAAVTFAYGLNQSLLKREDPARPEPWPARSASSCKTPRRPPRPSARRSPRNPGPGTRRPSAKRDATAQWTRRGPLRRLRRGRELDRLRADRRSVVRRTGRGRRPDHRLHPDRPASRRHDPGWRMANGRSPSGSSARSSTRPTSRPTTSSSAARGPTSSPSIRGRSRRAGKSSRRPARHRATTALRSRRPRTGRFRRARWTTRSSMQASCCSCR